MHRNKNTEQGIIESIINNTDLDKYKSILKAAIFTDLFFICLIITCSIFATGVPFEGYLASTFILMVLTIHFTVNTRLLLLTKQKRLYLKYVAHTYIIICSIWGVVALNILLVVFRCIISLF